MAKEVTAGRKGTPTDTHKAKKADRHTHTQIHLLLDLPHNIQALHDLAKHHVLAVQPLWGV